MPVMPIANPRTTRSSRPGRRRNLPARHDAQRGVSAIVFLVTLVITLGGLLAVVDLARIQLAQGRLQSALDSAVEAAVRRFGSAPGAEWEREINAWMQANHDVPFRLTVNRGQDSLSATADHNLPLFSAGFLSFDATTATVHAASSAFLSSGRRLEVAVALDTYTPPYSEFLDFRARTARQAAQQLIEALLPDDPDPNIRVGLIPFADIVKPVDPADKAQSRKLNGWLHSFWHPWLETWVPSSASPNPWAGCVTERGLYLGGTAPPRPPNLRAEPGTPGQLAPLFIPHALSLSPLDRNPLDWLAQIMPGSSPVARTPYAVTVGISGQRQLDVWLSTRAPNCVDMPAMTSLTDNKKIFGPTFEKLLPVKSGTDASMQPLGLLWAWRMLDPA
nr:hypothetical protein [Pseudomonas sp.]